MPLLKQMAIFFDNGGGGAFLSKVAWAMARMGAEHQRGLVGQFDSALADASRRRAEVHASDLPASWPPDLLARLRVGVVPEPVPWTGP
jgi:hypothetical protein